MPLIFNMTGATPGCCYPLTSIWWLSEGKCNDRTFSCFDDYSRLSTLYSYLLLLLIIIISYDFVMCTSSLLSAAAGCKPTRVVSSFVHLVCPSFTCSIYVSSTCRRLFIH